MRPALFVGKKRAERSTAVPRPQVADSARRAAAPSPRYGIVNQAVDRWRVELVTFGGPNALLDMAALGNTVLDLSSAHPSGVAQLYAGRPTPLTNIIRERTALTAARAKAREVQLLSDKHASRYGLPPTHLSIGIALWTEYVDADDAVTRQSVPPASVPPASAQPDSGRPDSAPPAPGAPVSRSAPTTELPTAAGNVIPLQTQAQAPPQKAVQRRVPIMLRPVAMGDDPREPELTLEPTVEVNPVLIRALRSRGCHIDAMELAAEAFRSFTFNPAPVLQRVEALGKTVLKDFRIRDKLIVGVFEHPGQLLVEDLDSAADVLANRAVVAALAGDRSAQRVFRGQQLPAVVEADRAPDHERGIGDLDIAQQHILDVVAKGHSVFLDAAPGAPVAETVAAVIADAAGSGRSTLYVTGNRRASHAVTARLRAAGLGDTILDLEPKPAWQRDAVAALRAGLELTPPPLDARGIGKIRSALADRSRQIANYIRALHHPREPWNVSAYDALEAIAHVTSDRPGTRTSVRLDQEACLTLQAEGLDKARGGIVRLAELGAFRLRAPDTPWHGAEAASDEAAADLLARLDRLRGGKLDATVAAMKEVAGESGLAEPADLAGWGEQLDMLAGIREALDVFLPLVFERSAEDMVAATATSEWRAERGVDLGRMDRNRLRKQAKDMVRPGRVVPDLHAALVHLQAQREIWIRWNPAGAWPRLPADMALIDAGYRAVRADADALGAALGLGQTPDRPSLDRLPLPELAALLDRLDHARDTLAYLPELIQLDRGLRAGGLGALLDDLTARRIGLAAGQAPAPLTSRDREAADLAGFELDLAWWSSVLSFMLAEDPLLGRYKGDALAALIDSYRELDLAHVATKPGPIAAAIAKRRGDVRGEYPGQAETLEGAADATPLRQLVAACPEVALSARPCWVTGPMLVPLALPLAESPAPAAGLVILDAVQYVTTAQAVSALARGSQVLVIGDSTRVAENPDSIATALAEFLPRVSLQAPPSRRDPRLTAFLAEHGYQTLGPPLPLPSRENLLGFVPVEGVGHVVAGSANVESADAEVDAVVREVVAHVRLRPTETLGVVTVSGRHAERVRAALARTSETVLELAGAFASDQVEPLVVADLPRCAGISRDAIIFSPGFAKTPHGHVLYNFGPVSGPGGKGMLLDSLVAVRHRLTVVSSLCAEDLAGDRLKDDAARLFQRILAFAESSGAPAAPHGEEADALFADLAERLGRRGFRVDARFGLPDGEKIPLAISHPAVPERELVAVLTDDPEFVAERSVRAQARLRAARLERLGWRTAQAWSPAVFMDPESEARAIAAVATEELERLRPGFSDG
ncbi:MAG: hypothetical protein LBT54_08175 [Bifidobacteriaceae bacterium]|nr:hypothetical protein [Bifidobacteriaceae bacterium]